MAILPQGLGPLTQEQYQIFGKRIHEHQIYAASLSWTTVEMVI